MVCVEHVIVEVIYALPGEQKCLKVSLPSGATIEEAILQSGILEEYPTIDFAECQVGVFGRIRRMQDPLQAGDRVEIYRPLSIDPMERRRRRAATG